MTAPLFHPLRVRAIEPDTDEAVILSFDVPPGLREVFSFHQGQYLTLRTEVDGADLPAAPGLLWLDRRPGAGAMTPSEGRIP